MQQNAIQRGETQAHKMRDVILKYVDYNQFYAFLNKGEQPVSKLTVH